MQGSTLIHRRPSRNSGAVAVSKPACIAATPRTEDNNLVDSIPAASRKRSCLAPALGLPKPPAAVHRYLRGTQHGAQLLQQLRNASLQVHEGLDYSFNCRNACKVIGYSIRDVHACLLQVDDDLMEPNLMKPDIGNDVVSACRTWLQKLQTFIMTMQRDLDAFMQEGCPQALHEAPLGCEASPGVQQEQHAAWHVFLHAMAAQFGHAVEAMDDCERQEILQEQEQQQEPCSVDQQVPATQPEQRGAPTAGTRKPLCRLVCSRSCLKYKMYWAGKVCL